MTAESKVCVLLAEGLEEIEAVTVIDVLRRAQIRVDTIGLSGTRIRGSHDIVIEADRDLREVSESESWDLVVLPGGLPGSHNLRDDPRVQQLVRRQHERGGTLAAICAAPVALSSAGVLQGRHATSYPGLASELPGALYCEDDVVVDENIITSRGIGTALSFALELVTRLKGGETAKSLGKSMLVKV